MRSIVACAAALSVAPLAAAGALSDEAALLQTKVHDGPAVEDNSFELICDELQGCHYRFHTSSTPTPYQLICDDKEGCRYTGVTQPPPKNPPPMLPQQGIDQLVALANKAAVGLMAKPAPKANPLANPNMADLVKNFKLPNMQQMPQLPQMPWTQQQTPRAPQAPQMPQMPDLGKWLQGLAPSTPAPSSDEPLAHFVPDNKMCCVEGPSDYIREKVEKIKSSPLGAGYQTTAALNGPCTSKGYDQGPSPEMCFPKAKVWMSRLHPIDPTSEPRLFADYAATHGWMAIPAGVMELCKP
uniref:Uncharacterized protein n=1 Tax=Alexandrium catenella TaxID=2925 RepID=A0A7S1S8Y2_ALECA